MSREKMPKRIWVRPTGWGNYCMTDQEAYRSPEDVEYICAALTEAPKVDVATVLDELYTILDNAFALGKNHDNGLVIDDTQVGAEFAFNYLTTHYDLVKKESK